MIIIKRQDDNILDVLDWLTKNVSPNCKPELEPFWSGLNNKKFEWIAANHIWRVVKDDRINEISVSIMDVAKERELKEYLNG